MNNNNLITFSKELWESGEYEIETKDGREDVVIYDTNFPDEKYSLIGRIGNEVIKWRADGKLYNNHVVTIDDLMLRKVMKRHFDS